MIPEKVFEKILVLGNGWRVRRVDYVEEESKVLIRIEETAALWAREASPHCNARSVGGYDQRNFQKLWTARGGGVLRERKKRCHHTMAAQPQDPYGTKECN